MSQTAFITLGDVCDFVNGGTPTRSNKAYYQGSIPWITSADITEGVVRKAREYITDEAISNSATRIIPAGNVLLVSRTGVGKVAVTGCDICISQDFTGLLPQPALLDTWYLYYFLVSRKSYLVSQQRGATIQGITREIVESLQIPLPSLEEQKRIASTLAKTDRLRRLRRYALELSDTFLQSVFLDMFGDPATNPKGWRTCTLGEVFLSAKDGPHVSPPYTQEGIPFLSTRNIRPGEVIWDDLKYISRNSANDIWKNASSKPQLGDLLYTKGGTTGLAAVVDFDRDIAVWVHVAVLKLKKNIVNPLWLEHMLNSKYCYHQSQELTFGIANHDLGLHRMPRICIYLPSIETQVKFASTAKRFSSVRKQHRESQRQSEHLYQSLLNHAFHERV